MQVLNLMLCGYSENFNIKILMLLIKIIYGSPTDEDGSCIQHSISMTILSPTTVQTIIMCSFHS